jgi:ubiquinone biosynthesis protein UbiJ
MKKMILSSLTKTINSTLNLDTESKQRIAKLNGKTIMIELLPLHLEFQCHFNENGVNLATDETMIANTTIRGTPLQMLGVMIAKENRQKFFAEDISIEGDAEFAQQVIDLFDHLQIDWEDYLSQLTGDVPAYHAARLFRKFNSFLSQSKKSFRQDMTEYLHEEAKWLPSREALADFFTEIDIMRMDVDRIEARIKNLAKTLIEDEVTP